MSVIWEAKCKLCRRAGQKLFLKGDRCFTRKCQIERESRNKPPGQHGDNAARGRRLTEYAEQLLEKQKLKRMYQLREKQFSAYMDEASRRRGVTGENMLQLLETRLDNFVYRLGWAPARGTARQLVNHRFFTVNGKRVNVPSFQLRPGDTVALHESKREGAYIKEALQAMAVKQIPSWIEVDTASFEGKVLRPPTKEELNLEINDQLIVEFYTR
ncbi:MAG TPA: 30S ribosomal protein S4 [Fimbriimonadales bacterium]|jgi:small subunit ribosomal protein S4|nr:30S ribosomal protein S4 [Fimbriimonadales bacterium]